MGGNSLREAGVFLFVDRRSVPMASCHGFGASSYASGPVLDAWSERSLT